MKPYTLYKDLEPWIEKYLNRWGHSLEKPEKLAAPILKVSDAFQKQNAITPWKDKDSQAAYLSYFFPLNFVRILKVIDEALHWGVFESVDEVFDFGCGPGTFTKALLQDPRIKLPSIVGCDSEPTLGSLFLDTKRSHTDLRFQTQPMLKPKKQSLLLASYVLNELEAIPPWFFNFQSIILLEPSTKQAFPRLLELRQKLQEQGFQILAPCPHSLTCPLSQSKKDWCHDRVLWDQPDWFEKLEARLPIKNKSLSFSYLIASKKPIQKEESWRVVGDPLLEKGKTRWMVCRNENRQFLSYLKKQGPTPLLSRGDRIQLKTFDEKGQELRFQSKDLSILS